MTIRENGNQFHHLREAELVLSAFRLRPEDVTGSALELMASVSVKYIQ